MSGIVSIKKDETREPWNSFYNVTSFSKVENMCGDDFEKIFPFLVNFNGDLEVEISKSSDKKCRVFLDTCFDLDEINEGECDIELNFLGNDGFSINYCFDGIEWLKPLCTFNLQRTDNWSESSGHAYLHDLIMPVKIRMRKVGAKRWVYPHDQKPWS